MTTIKVFKHWKYSTKTKSHHHDTGLITIKDGKAWLNTKKCSTVISVQRDRTFVEFLAHLELYINAVSVGKVERKVTC